METEQELVTRARESVSECNWTVGECAAEWTQRYARGRTDADFGALIAMSGDQVCQRRLVWQTFGDVRTEYTGLRWSHFYVAIGWDDAPECLAWAAENEATVAEMKAWRRLQHGEDLTQPAIADRPLEEDEPDEDDDYPDMPETLSVPTEPTLAFEPARDYEPEEPSPAMGSAARSSASGGTAVAEPPPEVDFDQVVKRMTQHVERCAKAMTAELVAAVPKLPLKTRNRFIKAVGELSAKAAKLL